MIVTQMRWLRARFATMMKQLGNWFDGFIRWSQKWCAPTGRDERVRRTFAK